MPLQCLGPYQVTDVLAETANSRVLRALDEQGRAICLKLLPLAVAPQGSEASLRFLQEAKLLASVRHSGVVRVLDFGETPEGPYLGLELISGQTLEEVIASRRLDIPEILELLIELADALAAVHDAGIVHSDLKPANLMLTRDGLAKMLKIVDFGLAVDSLSFRDRIAGTPHYMAPEQTRLTDWSIDARTDLYALGVIAYEMLSGKPPFDETDLASLLLAHVSKAPSSLPRTRNDLPQLLNRMVLKLLEKIPADRYQSARGLAADLRRLAESLKEGDARCEFPLDASEPLSDGIGQVFVSREAELATLGGALDRARRGVPSVVLVAGVAGVGKSTLLREFFNRSLLSGARYATGKCYEFARGLPYQVLADALNHHLSNLAVTAPQEWKALITSINANPVAASEIAKLLPGLSTELAKADGAKPSAGTADQFLGSLAVLLRLLAPKGRPLMLLLDDLQWSDAGTLNALEFVMSALTDVSLAFVCTYRSEALPESPTLERFLKKLAAGGSASVVELTPLTLEQTKILIAESLRQPVAGVPVWLGNDIYERAGGNPLFVNELLRAFVMNGAVHVTNGELRVFREKLDAANLPTSIIDVVLQRTQQMDESIRGPVCVAAALGKSFNLQLLAAAAERPSNAVFEAVSEATRNRIIRQLPGGTYTFAHDRVREAFISLLLPDEKRSTHRAVVRYLEAQLEGAAPDVDTVYALAEHASLAEDHPRAFRYCADAGTAASGRHGTDLAVLYLSKTIAHGQAGGVPSSELLPFRIRLGEALEMNGSFDASEGQYAVVLDTSTTRAQRARARLGLAAVAMKRGEYGCAEEQLTEAARLLGVKLRFDEPTWALRARVALARVQTRLSPRRSSVEEKDLLYRILRQLSLLTVNNANKVLPVSHRLMAEAIRFGPSGELAFAHSFRGVALLQGSRPNTKLAIYHADEGVRIAEATGVQLDVAVAKMYAGAIRTAVGPHPWKNFRSLREAQDTLKVFGNMHQLANTYIFLFNAYRASGLFDQAADMARALYELGERIGAHGSTANGHIKFAEVLFLKGDTAVAKMHLELGRKIALDRKLNLETVLAAKAEAAFAIFEGRYADAQNHAQSGVDVLRRPGVSLFRNSAADTELWLLEARLRDPDQRLDEAALAAVERELSEILAVERHARLYLAHAERVAGLLHWRKGNHGRAIALLSRVRRRCKSEGRSYDEALTWLDLARIVQERDPVEARRCARAARFRFETWGLDTLVGLADAVSGDSRRGQGRGSAHPTDSRAFELLDSFVQTAESLAETNDMDGILEDVVQSSIKLVGAERGFIFSVAPGATAPEIRVGRLATGQNVLGHAGVSMSIVEQVWGTGKGIASSNTHEDASLQNRQSISVHAIRSVLCVPLESGGRRYGVLYLDNTLAKANYTAGELGLLTAFATQAGVAMALFIRHQEKRLLGQSLSDAVRERKRSLEAANLRLHGLREDLEKNTLRLLESERAAMEKEMKVVQDFQIKFKPPAAPLTTSGGEIIGDVLSQGVAPSAFWCWAEQGARTYIVLGRREGAALESALLNAMARGALDSLPFVTGRLVDVVDQLHSTLTAPFADDTSIQLIVAGFCSETRLLSIRSSQSLEGWLKQPSQSTRASISRRFDTKYEPGSVVVLTSNRSESRIPELAELLYQHRGGSPSNIFAKLPRTVSNPSDDVAVVVGQLA